MTYPEAPPVEVLDGHARVLAGVTRGLLLQFQAEGEAVAGLLQVPHLQAEILRLGAAEGRKETMSQTPYRCWLRLHPLSFLSLSLF